MKKVFLFGIFLLVGCSSQQTPSESIAMIQVVDRMGMNETIKQKEKLKNFEGIDFEKPQPFQKVIRVFQKVGNGLTKSILTTYHENGFLKEYLEASSHRANGKYKEFYSDGRLKIDGHVIEGIADLTDSAKQSFVFDGICKVYYPSGNIQAEISYQKGKLEGESVYFFDGGTTEKKIPYVQDKIHGKASFFNEKEKLIGFTEFAFGKKHGQLIFYGDSKTPYFEELYQNGCLEKGKYWDFDNEIVGEIQYGFGNQVVFENGHLKSVIEYRKGVPEGIIKTYYASGNLESQYSLKNGAKHGEEWVYYDHKHSIPKLFLSWYEDQLHGSQKSWYEDGSLESQKEMIHNQKHGQLIAWFKTGGVMLMEEYEMNKLKDGSYYSKTSLEKVSHVVNGKGIATIFDKDGFFLHKVRYEKGEITGE